MEERSPKNILKTVLIVLAVFAAAILHIFVSSAVQGRNYKGKTSDMYGIDSLEYVGEPVMKIFVWQRNNMNPVDYPSRDTCSAFYYYLLPLEMTTGNSICTVSRIEKHQNLNNTIINVEYDGMIKGEYEVKWEGSAIYSEMNDTFPNDWFYATKNKVFSHEDASFCLNGNMTLNIVDVGTNMLRNQRMNTYYRSKLIEERKYWDYASEQSIHEIYPDAPDSLSQVYRLVITGDLTINAMHERKEDVPIATAVLEIKQYSKWIAPDVETSRELEKFCDSISYADVTVKSYTQTVQWE